MKRCPQCGAQYDDHVEFCFVDGTELAAISGSATPSLSLGPTPTSPPMAAPLPVAPNSPLRRALPLVLAFGVLAALLMFTVIVLALMRSDPDPPAPTPEPVAVAPSPVRPPEPLPTVAKVVVESTPEGAEVWEGSTLLCNDTPCTVDHPEHAPIPREFVLKMRGFREARLVMDDPGRGHHATLQREGRKRRPAPPRPANASDILGER